MSIETARLILRSYSEEDLAELARILGDPATMAFWPRPFTASEAEHWMRRAIEQRETTIYGRRGVFLRATGELIGDAGVVRAELDGVERDDLGYIIRSERWGQGFATEAARALASHYQFNHSCKALFANMAHDHTASQRVAQRIGMRRCGEYHNSRNRNILTYLYLLEREA